MQEERFTIEVTTYNGYETPYEALLRVVNDANEDMTVHLEIIEDEQKDSIN